jgi:mono/diheme cytochrome c family protein
MKMWRRIRNLGCVAVGLAILSLVVWSALASAAAPPPDAKRGQYVFHLSGGCGCHADAFGHLAGGREFAGPFGVVYAPNLTADPQTGIGKWTDQQIIDATRLGKDNEGKQLFPVMPYPAYSGMSDQDAVDLVAYLRTVVAVKHAAPEDKLNVPAPPFTPRQAPPAAAPASGALRGAYLANAVAICGDCHTPKKPDGSPDMTKVLAGAPVPNDGYAPNITPDDTTGIGKWTDAQIARLLRTGYAPDESVMSETMDEVIRDGYQNMSESDALAIAAFLKTIPAVKSAPPGP